MTVEFEKFNGCVGLVWWSFSKYLKIMQKIKTVFVCSVTRLVSALTAASVTVTL